jgi:hypothetical protein
MTIEIPEVAFELPIARGLLKAEDRTKPWPFIQACYASLMAEEAMRRLIRNGVIKPGRRCCRYSPPH